jgi:hypothetical protein
MRKPQKPRPRIRRSPEQWHQILDELESSGLSRSAFCRQKGLLAETLRQAERRVGRHEQRARFVELSSPALLDDEPRRRWDIELELGDGVVLRLGRR